MNIFYKKGRFEKITGILLVAFVLLISQLGISASAKRVTDTQAPTVPQNLVATSVGQTSVALKWSPSTDNKGIASYLIYKNSQNIASTKLTSYTVSGLAANTTYSFIVKAKDYSGNISLGIPANLV